MTSWSGKNRITGEGHQEKSSLFNFFQISSIPLFLKRGFCSVKHHLINRIQKLQLHRLHIVAWGVRRWGCGSATLLRTLMALLCTSIFWCFPLPVSDPTRITQRPGSSWASSPQGCSCGVAIGAGFPVLVHLWEVEKKSRMDEHEISPGFVFFCIWVFGYWLLSKKKRDIKASEEIDRMDVLQDSSTEERTQRNYAKRGASGSVYIL